MTDNSVCIPPKTTDWKSAKPKSKRTRHLFSDDAISAFVDKHINEAAGPSPQMRGLKERRVRAEAKPGSQQHETLLQCDDRWPVRIGALLSLLRSR